jgi:membrane dipeptidase
MLVHKFLRYHGCYRHWTAVALGTLLGGCAAHLDPRAADSILDDAIVVDTHIDAPFRIERSGADVVVGDPGGQFDLARAEQGRLGAAFMSIFIPAQVDVDGNGVALADRLIDHVEAVVTAAPQRAGLATCVADVRELKAAGRLALALGMENGGPLLARDALDHFVARGIRYVTLTHSKANGLADSSYDGERPWDGLSPAGFDMVRRLNAAGVMVDVSHLADAATRDVLATSAVPIIASHSSARHFVPGFERNLDDELIRAIAAAGGVIQVNFGSGFISAEARAWQARWEEVFARFSAEAQVAYDSPQAGEFRTRYLAAHPYPRADLDTVLDHIDYIVKLAGVTHVGLGSDFDGVGDTLPTGLEDVSRYPNLVRGLIERGYRRDGIVGILGENLLRVWGQVESFARQQGGAVQCAL